MKLSYNWLKELVKINVSAEKLAEEMSLYSVEVENIEKLVKVFGLVVGKVLTKEKHPDADKLSVCSVDLGSSISQIVCGAPNVAAGQKVIVALPGTNLPGGEIKVSVIRGVPSNGMICSLQELGIDAKYIPQDIAHGIYILGDDAEVGSDALAYLNYDDYVIELGLTPNRMDLLSMLGIANDVNAMYNLGLKPLQFQLKEKAGEINGEITVEIQTSTCYSYYARVIKDVVIKESPQFIKTRLIAAGIRPINNIVDITNYVLVLFGQPLHAFDQDQLGDKIIVRRATENEEVITLDHNKRRLNRNDIVITDNKTEEGRIVCLAGVMGAVNTEVTTNTKNIVLESAVFRPLNVRRTSSKLGLRSESSIRYERGVDLNNSLAAANYACYLMEKYANAKVCKGYIHQGTEKIVDREFTLDESYIENYLGIHISLAKMKEIFERLSFKVAINGENLVVKVPNRRLDITIREDLVEEIARINGYQYLKETLPIMNLSSLPTKEQNVRQIVQNSLRGMGLDEVITYSLVNEVAAQEFDILGRTDEKIINLLHPLSEERTTLRKSLLPSLIEVAKYHSARKMNNLAFFEIGKKYYMTEEHPYEEWLVSGLLSGKQADNLWSTTFNESDFYYVKGIVETLFKQLNINVKYQRLSITVPQIHPEQAAEIIYNNKIIGHISSLHPAYLKDNDLGATFVFEIKLNEISARDKVITSFQSISKVPAVERDLALVMSKNQPVGEVINAIYRTDKTIITAVEVFDLYTGDKIDSAKKSVAFKITFESDTTFTEEIINAKIQKILKSLEYQYQITLRS